MSRKRICSFFLIHLFDLLILKISPVLPLKSGNDSFIDTSLNHCDYDMIVRNLNDKIHHGGPQRIGSALFCLGGDYA